MGTSHLSSQRRERATIVTQAEKQLSLGPSVFSCLLQGCDVASARLHRPPGAIFTASDCLQTVLQ